MDKLEKVILKTITSIPYPDATDGDLTIRIAQAVREYLEEEGRVEIERRKVCPICGKAPHLSLCRFQEPR